MKLIHNSAMLVEENINLKHKDAQTHEFCLFFKEKLGWIKRHGDLNCRPVYYWHRCAFSPVIMFAVLTAGFPLGRLADPVTRD